MTDAIITGICLLVLAVVSLGIIVFGVYGLIRSRSSSEFIVVAVLSISLVLGNAALDYTYIDSINTCPNCEDIHFSEDYCPKCGTSLHLFDVICGKCHSENSNDNNYCYKCGERLRGE